MNWQLFVLWSVLFCFLAGCKAEPIKYKMLSPEEIEILYGHHHPELLTLVCEKYYTVLIKTPEEKWLIQGYKHKEKIRKKFLSYCMESTQKGHKDAACYLAKFYSSEQLSGGCNTSNYIYYNKLCKGK